LHTAYNVKKTRDMGNGIQKTPGSSGIKKKQNQDFVKALKTNKIAKDPIDVLKSYSI
jgi:hypothetical protein